MMRIQDGKNHLDLGFDKAKKQYDISHSFNSYGLSWFLK